MKRGLKTMILALTGWVLLAPLSLASEQAVKIGVISCEAIEGTRVNLIIRSTVDVACTFETVNGEKHAYKGETGIELGLDLSFRTDEQFAFTVITSVDKKFDKQAVAGKYIGAKAAASIGVGLGAAALIGGSDNNFGLQPLAIEANKGFGVAAGIGFLYIEPH